MWLWENRYISRMWNILQDNWQEFPKTSCHEEQKRQEVSLRLKKTKDLFGSWIEENIAVKLRNWGKLNRDCIVYKTSNSYTHLLYLRFNLSLVTSASNRYAFSTYINHVLLQLHLITIRPYVLSSVRLSLHRASLVLIEETVF